MVQRRNRLRVIAANDAPQMTWWCIHSRAPLTGWCSVGTGCGGGPSLQRARGSGSRRGRPTLPPAPAPTPASAAIIGTRCKFRHCHQYHCQCRWSHPCHRPLQPQNVAIIIDVIIKAQTNKNSASASASPPPPPSSSPASPPHLNRLKELLHPGTRPKVQLVQCRPEVGLEELPRPDIPTQDHPPDNVLLGHLTTSLYHCQCHRRGHCRHCPSSS
jgi:hypothetical protein